MRGGNKKRGWWSRRGGLKILYFIEYNLSGIACPIKSKLAQLNKIKICHSINQLKNLANYINYKADIKRMTETLIDDNFHALCPHFLRDSFQITGRWIPKTTRILAVINEKNTPVELAIIANQA